MIVASESSGGQSMMGGVNRPNVLKWSPIVPHVRRGSRYPAPHMLHVQRSAGTAGVRPDVPGEDAGVMALRSKFVSISPSSSVKSH